MLGTAWVLLLPKILADTAAINVCGKYHRISPKIYIVIMNCMYLLIFAVKVRFLCLAEKCSGQNVSKSSQLMVFPPEPAYPFPSLHGWCSWGASSAVAASCIAWHWSAQDLLSKSMVSSVNFPLEHQHLGLSRTIFSYFFHSENWKIKKKLDSSTRPKSTKSTPDCSTCRCRICCKQCLHCRSTCQQDIGHKWWYLYGNVQHLMVQNGAPKIAFNWDISGLSKLNSG